MNHLARLVSILASASVVQCAVPAQDAEQTAKPRRPNVVFLISDDLGAQSLGCYGGGVLREGEGTPRIPA